MVPTRIHGIKVSLRNMAMWTLKSLNKEAHHAIKRRKGHILFLRRLDKMIKGKVSQGYFELNIKLSYEYEDTWYALNKEEIAEVVASLGARGFKTRRSLKIDTRDNSLRLRWDDKSLK